MLLGDTFTDGTVKYTMTSMNVPEPVMSLAVSPVSKDSGGQVSNFMRPVNYSKLICILALLRCVLLTVFKSIEPFSKRRSDVSCWIGSRKWADDYFWNGRTTFSNLC